MNTNGLRKRRDLLVYPLCACVYHVALNCAFLKLGAFAPLIKHLRVTVVLWYSFIKCFQKFDAADEFYFTECVYPKWKIILI